MKIESVIGTHDDVLALCWHRPGRDVTRSSAVLDGSSDITLFKSERMIVFQSMTTYSENTTEKIN